MNSIVLTRIDDRLIHGQFVTSWLNRLHVNSLLIIDNELSKNDFMKKIYKSALPNNLELNILNLEDSIGFILSNSIPIKQTIILAKNPFYIEGILHANIPINHLVLGGMGATDDRKRLYRNIHVSLQELQSMKRILNMKCKIYYQLVPDDSPVDMSKIILQRCGL